MYSGDWKDGAPNGEGIGYGLNEENEVIWIYQGSWINGLMDGYGEITFPGRITYYKGEWKNGQRFGNGERRMPDGTIIPLTYVKYEIKINCRKKILIIFSCFRDKEFKYNPVKVKSRFMLPMETFRYTGQINNKTGLPENHGIGNTYIFGIFWAGRYTGFWHNGYVNGFGVLEASTQGKIRSIP